jgi:preprotein translocase subunit SecF
LRLPHVDIVKYRAWWFGISLAITVPGLIAVIVCMFTFGTPLKLGIDFTGGSIMQYEFVKDDVAFYQQKGMKEEQIVQQILPLKIQKAEQILQEQNQSLPKGQQVPSSELSDEQKAEIKDKLAAEVKKDLSAGTVQVVPMEELRTTLEDVGYKGSQVQEAQIGGKRVIIMRTKAMADDKQDEELKKKLDQTFQEKFGDFQQLSRDKVSGVVGPELLQSGLLALFITLGAMVLYIGSRFQYDFAVCAIIALFHDVLVLVGAFALLGLVAGIEVDSLFISAILTVVGFSVHDTIVVFDRVRENSKFVGSKSTDPVTGREYRKTFGDVANDSVNQTLARSIYTSLTVVITLTALYVLGGTTTRDFVLAMLIGIISGTYSSIFNASALLVWWREKRTTKGGGKATASTTPSATTA